MSEYGEPWKTWGTSRCGIKNRLGEEVTLTMSEPDAERIVACVNFLRGVPTEDLSAVEPYGDCGQCVRDTIIACADAIRMPLEPDRQPSPMMVKVGTQLWEQFKDKKTALAGPQAIHPDDSPQRGWESCGRYPQPKTALAESVPPSTIEE